MNHVFPCNDLKPHKLDGVNCECGPRLVRFPAGGDACLCALDHSALAEAVVVHRAFDHREFFEEAERIFNNPDAYIK